MAHIAADSTAAQGIAESTGLSALPPTVVLDSDGGEWARLREVEVGGAILVRPDGHVGWRCGRPLAAPVQGDVDTLPGKDRNYTALHAALSHLLCDKKTATPIDYSQLLNNLKYL